MNKTSDKKQERTLRVQKTMRENLMRRKQQSRALDSESHVKLSGGKRQGLMDQMRDKKEDQS